MGANEDDSKTWDSSTYISFKIPTTGLASVDDALFINNVSYFEIMLKTLLYLCLFFK